MTNRKISELPEAALPLKDTDLIPIVQDTDDGKVTNKVSVSAFGKYAPAGPQGPKGDKGDTGAQGATGPQGPAGKDGSVADLQKSGKGNGVKEIELSTSSKVLYVGMGNFLDTDTTDEQTVNGYVNFKNGAGNDGSDMRFKTDIAPLGDVLDKVMKLDVISYHWNRKGEERDTFGLNATQVKEYFPRICHTRDDNDKTEWLEYDRFGVIALKAIQELASKVKKLEQEITILKNQRNG